MTLPLGETMEYPGFAFSFARGADLSCDWSEEDLAGDLALDVATKGTGFFEGSRDSAA